MNMTKMIVCGLMAVPMLTQAMPSKADLDKVSPVVADLMKPEQDALKAGKKTKSEVADAALELVKQADGESAKLLLAKGAFNLYVRDGQFDKALDTLKVMRTEVPDITPQYLSNIIETALRRVSKKNGGQLYQILDETKTLARYQDELKKLEAQAKKRPADKALQTKLAEHHAVLGDWTKALEHFAKGEDAKAAQMAKDEKDGAKDAKAIADFWWTYPDKRGDEFEKPFKQHAAALYSQAVASGKLVGLNKVQADRRIEEAKELGEAIYEAETKDGLYCVIDLSGGPNATKYPVGYLNDVPKGGWTDEYKTTKLVLRRIEPGSYVMGDASLRFKERAPVPVKITKSFYIGVFEITESQWSLVMGPAVNLSVLPRGGTSYDMIRGIKRGAEWPASSEVDAGSFMGTLRIKTDLLCDLPTAAQWEYAARAGAISDYYNGKNLTDKDAIEALKEIANFKSSAAGRVAVGILKPNAWGVYDMLGSVHEWCLDASGDRSGGNDPVGPVAGKLRICCGGAYCDPEQWCMCHACINREPSVSRLPFGFRLAIQPSFVPPKSAEKKCSPTAEPAASLLRGRWRADVISSRSSRMTARRWFGTGMTMIGIAM